MVAAAGYDIGGAHLKVARVEDGRLTAVRQFAMPLWEGLDRLDAVLSAATDITSGASSHAVTMTGELAEVFNSRQDGVRSILTRFARQVQGTMHVYMGLKGLASPEVASAEPEFVGSTNFLATAQVIAARRCLPAEPAEHRSPSSRERHGRVVYCSESGAFGQAARRRVCGEIPWHGTKWRCATACGASTPFGVTRGHCLPASGGGAGVRKQCRADR